MRSSGRAESWRQVCRKGLLVFERAARLAHGGQPPTGAPRPLGQQSGSAAGVRAPAATRPDTHESSADPRPLLLGARDPEPSPGVENRCARGLRSPSPFSTAHSVSLLPPPRPRFLAPATGSTVEGSLSKKKQKKTSGGSHQDRRGQPARKPRPNTIPSPQLAGDGIHSSQPEAECMHLPECVLMPRADTSFARCPRSRPSAPCASLRLKLRSDPRSPHAAAFDECNTCTHARAHTHMLAQRDRTERSLGVRPQLWGVN